MAKFCSKCGNKIRFDEYSHNGLCEICYKGSDQTQIEDTPVEEEEIINDIQENTVITNSTAQIIRVIGFIQIIAGIIAVFALGENQFYVGIAIFISAFVTGILEIGFGEVIQLLEDIKNKQEFKN